MAHTSEEELTQKLAEAKSKVDVNSKYYHYKSPNDYYSIVTIALDEEKGDPCVVYKAEYGGGLTWIRPITNFLEGVKREDGAKTTRFTKVIE